MVICHYLYAVTPRIRELLVLLYGLGEGFIYVVVDVMNSDRSGVEEMSFRDVQPKL